ncbi:MAG: recombination protein RecR [Methylotenera sp.]|nr:MAG: recombination protein RecR [Proteobacteria bacterium ST_bin12]PPC87159.1 MAG: recombination protein RecR [Methylotenera sp.]PPD18297.1 MAG: recombination protein RecR [Methylotenera sp.]
MKNPPALEQLIDSLRCLPGVGPKSALRMAYYLLQRDRKGAAKLGNSLGNALQVLGHCTLCNNFSETPICPLCASEKREQNQLCVVEMPTDLMMMEQTQSYNGMYFVLMGRLSPLDGVGPKEINLDKLIKRAQNGVTQEVILATNYTVEGEATAHYISELLKTRGVSVSRIARGLPMGGEIEYVDSGTLSMALLGRKQL